jgi:membrane associated rhomboid family serine protease
MFIPFRDDVPIPRPAVVTWGLIGACTLVYLWQAGLTPVAEQRVDYVYGMVPAVLFDEQSLPRSFHPIPAWQTLFTCMFLHGSVLHLGGNMLYLWIFGRGVENALGPVRYLLLYLASGIVAALTQASTDPHGTEPMIGASGAIAGILGAYLLLYPRANVDVFFWLLIFVRIIRVPALLMLGLWFLLQLLSALAAAPNEPGVAFWAHVGGFVAGLLLVALIRPEGTRILQERRAAPFGVRRLDAFGGGSVPRAGRRPWKRRGPWDF